MIYLEGLEEDKDLLLDSRTQKMESAMKSPGMEQEATVRREWRRVV